MPYSYNKLRGRIIEMYGSQEKFADSLGISRVAMSNKLNCKSGFSQNDIVKWSKLLSIERADYGAYFFN